MNNLKECVAALKDVRHSIQSDADDCILAAIDKAIAELERCIVEGGSTEQSAAQAGVMALAVLSDIITCVGGIAELVKLFGA